MKLSTRNILKGKVMKVTEGVTTALVSVDVGSGNVIKSLISMEAVKDLGIKVGEDIFALIKATSVMLGKE